MSKNYQELLRGNNNKHETSAPYSPHQNGTAERNCRTLFHMARCMLIESQLPKNLWTYAVQTAAVVRNRCFNNRIKETPYFMLSGRRPNPKCRSLGQNVMPINRIRRNLTQVFSLDMTKNSPAYFGLLS